MVKQRIELWTGREDFKRKAQAVQYDSARTLECAVMDAALPEGATAHFFAAKPSGKKVYLDCAVAGNTVSVELPDQALAETGSIPCQIEIFDKSEKRVSSFEFILDVKKTLITDAAIESTDAVTALKKYVDAAKGSADAAKKSETAAGSAKDGAVSAKTAAEDAKSKAEAAQSKAETAQKAAQVAQTAAETAQKDAAASKTAAAASAKQAENWTNQSKSWAVGEGYPERSDQAKDNSKYYASQAKASHDAVKAVSDKLLEIAGGEVVNSVNGRTDKVTLTSEDVGLGNVDNTADSEKNVAHAKTADTATDPTKLPLSGGTLTGTLNVGNKLSLRTDDEGGNIDIGSPDRVKDKGYWKIDAYDGNLRFFNLNGTAIKTALSLAADGTGSFNGAATKVSHALTFTGGVTGNYDGSADKSVKIPSTALDVGALPLSGGTLTGTLNVGKKLNLRTDGEGGNIDIRPPDNYSGKGYWEIDAYNGNLRFFNLNGGVNRFPLTLNADDAAKSTFSGTAATAAKLASTSDIRQKSDVRPIPEDFLNAFKNLKPRAYTLTATGEKGIGLIAQEIQGTALEDVLVSEGADGMLTLDYTNLHGLEITMIQSLLKQVESLQAEINELKTQIKNK